ncbi:transglutaminase domain-containing protein [Rheinheimera maricola]|uniref:Transglutaminase domain-containing protein n=1 Tax=Rheinheimera maricola TaxID=2793282 RepID=A0ABS7X9N4_9GAMM|nr:transglutaminase domain-containing protein [Rheinheimera maricola]MBZ9612264.1 hypothetical protein [Rheinheimera maricola]
MKTLLLCTLLLAISWPAAAYKLKLQHHEQHTQFHYHFSFANQPQQLSFSITNAELTDDFRQFRRFQTSLLQQYLWRDLKAHVARYPGARIQRQAPHNSLSYRLQLRDPALLQQLQQELQSLIAERTQHYLQQEYYYQQTMPLGEQIIIPDHVRFMQDSLQGLLPVAEALHSTLQNIPRRDSVHYIAAWLQQIPYQDLSDRQHSAGTSYSPPLSMLRQNRGDCDSKAVLLAALVRMLLPDVKMAFIYLPGHAMLAMQLPVDAGDDSVSIESQRYLLLDPTGPAQLAPGQISPELKIYTLNNQFGYRLF